MVIKSNCQLVAALRIIANISNPEARWTRTRYTKCRRSRYNRVEWWTYVAIKQILIYQVVPSVHVGYAELTCATN